MNLHCKCRHTHSTENKTDTPVVVGSSVFYVVGLGSRLYHSGCSNSDTTASTTSFSFFFISSFDTLEMVCVCMSCACVCVCVCVCVRACVRVCLLLSSLGGNFDVVFYLWFSSAGPQCTLAQVVQGYLDQLRIGIHGQRLGQKQTRTPTHFQSRDKCVQWRMYVLV